MTASLRAGRGFVAIASLSFAVMAVPPHAAATPSVVIYASPHGSGAGCTKAAPCALVTAVNDADADSEIVITPGTYGSAAHPLTTTLEDNAADLDIHGEPGARMPVIYSAASGDAVELTLGSSFSNVKIITSASAYGVADTGNADHLFVIDTAKDGTACAVYGTLADSLCVATGTLGTAIGLTATSTTTTFLYGDTAEARGTDGTGLSAATAASAPFSVFGNNDVVHGTTVDATAHNGGGPVTIGISFSDYKTTSANTGASVLSDPTNLDTAPRFIDPAALNFHEAAGSPTVNAGTSDPTGETDLAGIPRTQGSTPDMGAYEYVRPPAAADLRITKRTGRTIHVSVTVNPRGLAGTVEVVATHNGRRHTSPVRQAGAGIVARTIELTVHDLKPHTTYFLHAVARTAAGHTATPRHTARTR